MALVDHWPLYGLAVRTPRLELRHPDDEMAAAVAELAARGISPSGFRPFLVNWDEVPSPHLERNALQHFWTNRASWTPDSWRCPFAVVAEGVVVGVQDLLANDFATLRTVRTGSWLGRDHQGRGLGSEMRAAVLHLAFAGLGAVRAESGAWHDNAASLAVSRKLGYQENGDALRLRGDDPDREVRLLLTREAWEQHRRPDINLVGLDPCLTSFGAVEGEWLLPSSRSGER